MASKEDIQMGPREVCDFDNKLLILEEEKLKLFKHNIQDSEMQFLMSLLLKQISPSLAVRANIIQSLMNFPQYSPSPSQYQSSSDEWRSKCPTSQSGVTYTIIKKHFSNAFTRYLQQAFFNRL